MLKTNMKQYMESTRTFQDRRREDSLREEMRLLKEAIKALDKSIVALSKTMKK